jgi:5'/3'-nucleotidase
MSFMSFMTFMTILLTNDDGVRSEGLEALAAAVAPLGEVIIVAPLQEASAIGHALTLRRPLRCETIRPNVYGVDGTPTDCVNIAVTTVLRRLPDLILSGINKGWNLGDDVTYSGTVSGALAGALLGVPSLAVSLQKAPDARYDFREAAQAAAVVAGAVLRRGLPARTFLNINVPRGRPKGFRITVQGRRNHVTTVAERVDPRGMAYYWIEEGENRWESHDRSDYEAVKDGYVSVTPLHPDMTAHSVLPAIEELPLDVPSEVR